MTIYLNYWAKADRDENQKVPAYHLLPYHLLDVAACMEELLHQMPGATEHLSKLLGVDSDSAVPMLTWLAGLHDSGKFSEGFQGLRPDIYKLLTDREAYKGYHIRHDALGRTLIRDHLLCTQPFKDWLHLGEGTSGGRTTRKLLEPLIEAIASHHGSPAQIPHRQDAEDHFTDADYEAFRSFADDFYLLLNVAPRWPVDIKALKPLFKRGSWALAGWMVLADWLGSNEDFFPFEQEKMPLQDYWIRAREQAKTAVERSGVIAPPSTKYEDHRKFFPTFNALSPLQDYAEQVELEAGPQLFILEDATGSGKTEAALILSLRMMNRKLANGLYIGLPTTATANGMYERMEHAYQHFFDSLEPASLMLAHSSRDIAEGFQASIDWTPKNINLNDTYDKTSDATASATCAAWLSNSSKKALLAPIGVGTIDQALLAGLPAKHQCLRLVGLGQKVLIVDEVHAYDVYMSGLLQNLLRFHAAQGGSAILLSATLPRNQRQQLCDAFSDGLELPSSELQSDAFPLATHCAQKTTEIDIADYAIDAKAEGRAIGPQKSHDVKVIIESDIEECVAHLVEAAEKGRCACWIRNTVGEAIDAHEMLRSRIDEDKLTLFHARFTLSDRTRIENEVLKNFGKNSEPEDRAGRIVIATQVIEQSLDLDFDHMVSDLAPVDLMIQRAGRMHRHDRKRDYQPRLVIFGPQPTEDADKNWYSEHFNGAQWVYRDHGQLWLSAYIFAAEGKIEIPDNARKLVEFVYDGEWDELIPEALEESRFDAFAEEFVHEDMAHFNALNFDRGYGEGSSGRWFEDTRTPTRLGDPTITLRLGRVLDDDRIEPWVDASNKNAWRLSEVSVRATKFANIADTSISATLLKHTVEAMFDKGKWSELVPLTLLDEELQIWGCPIVDAKGDEYDLTYSPEFGLLIISEDK